MQPAEAPSPGQTQDSGGGGGGPTTPSTLLYGAVPRRPNGYIDRSIPDRSTVDFDLANYLFTETKKRHDNSAVVTPQSEAYQKRLADSVFQGRDRIFRLKPLPSVSSTFQVGCTDHAPSTRKIRCIPQSAEWVLDASELVDDFYLNLLDWSSRNLLAIALRGTVALLNPSDWSTSTQLIVNEQCGPVTSINWNDDGQRLAIGLNDSTVEIWDTNSMCLLRILRGCHDAGVGSLSWRNDILTTRGMDGNIVLNDVRKKSHIFRTYRGHEEEVYGLKWAGSAQQLASGGNDNRVHIWDLLYTPTPNQWLFRFDDHRAAVKALAWCPFQSNLLASGGGSEDRCIKFWNINSGTCLNSVDTGSQVCALLWNKNEKELLSSHGFDQNQLILWRYPSMVRMAELKGHKSRVLFMAQSPDGCTVASAAGNDTLRLWNVFGDPRAHKTVKTTSLGPFSSSRCIVR